MKQKKSLLIVCDGLGDRLTNGKTPLEAANTPNMDFIAEKGINGIMDTVKTGIRPGSDTAHLSLFGYDPFEVYTGRGPFEAFGAGLEMEKGDVAMRCNFSTLDKDKVVDRRAGRYEEGLDELTNEIKELEIDDVKLIFHRCTGHRGVLIMRGKNLSSNITDTDPEALNAAVKKSVSLDGKPDSKRTADIINRFTEITKDIFSNHEVNKKRIKNGEKPANIVLCRGSGIKPDLVDFQKKYGINGACISATSLIKGVCRAIGMDIIEVDGATGHVDSDIKVKTNAAIDALKKYDFVFLHVKGTDEASHDGNFDAKREMIERIDKEVIGLILENLKDVTIALTADHSTPLGIMQHSADPVPIAIIGDVRTDSVKKFDERNCSKGGLNRISGNCLLNIILDISNRSKLFGA